MENPKRTFPTLGVVSAYTGILVSDIGDVYDVLGFVLDDKLMTHQLPNASDAARPALREQHPWLAELDVPKDLDALLAWCDELVRERGEALPLYPAVDAEWVAGNALEDLADVAPGKPILAVYTYPEEHPEQQKGSQ